ncbi:hypothetical protein MKK68_19900 [Methylobacterium sp. E-016]|uniref:hypothetical protein n=1 Tax=Methylobacterium sp. E-016 TaxID=2836556 RepID=UPI001FBBA3C6|nr:hypothetical protein [Methylobacterium sp. E-016]MCJ2077878.1 hypothetical protein [Methylobacterium sp. E-016]
MPKIPTFAVAGLWLAITVAALSAVASEQTTRSESVAAIAETAVSVPHPVTTASNILTDATGNRYRKRRD